jgi:hypothetical protein
MKKNEIDALKKALKILCVDFSELKAEVTILREVVNTSPELKNIYDEKSKNLDALNNKIFNKILNDLET